jgi:hypothetical protein
MSTSPVGETSQASLRRSRPSNASVGAVSNVWWRKAHETVPARPRGPIGRIVRDHMLPFVFRYLVTEQSLAWMFEHHIDWNSRTARDELVA